jgi:hypothetical protein
MLERIQTEPKSPASATFDDEALAEIAGALNRLLADSFALYLKTKNFHWHISGPHFRDYHLLLDEQAAQIFATTDPIAERVRKIGGTTLRSVGEIGRLQRIAEMMLTICRPAPCSPNFGMTIVRWPPGCDRRTKSALPGETLRRRASWRCGSTKRSGAPGFSGKRFQIVER